MTRTCEHRGCLAVAVSARCWIDSSWKRGRVRVVCWFSAARRESVRPPCWGICRPGRSRAGPPDRPDSRGRVRDGARIRRLHALCAPTGALHLLPNALNYLAAFNVHSGAFTTAATLTDEVDSITQATGIPPLRYSAAMLAAARGDEARALFEWSWPDSTERGEGSGLRQLLGLTPLRHNPHSHYDEALAAARQAREHAGLT